MHEPIHPSMHEAFGPPRDVDGLLEGAAALLGAETLQAFSSGLAEPASAGTHDGWPRQKADSLRVRPEPPQFEHARFGDLYGASPGMKDLFRLLSKVAPTQAIVLVTGESGTGKELVASTLHKLSGLGRRPFVAVNCGAFPANLVEAELFGHERGGFTGAVRSRKGCFERAGGGTLFLDEIAEMPVEMQVKLLRVLETGRFCRVGGDEEVEVKVRVVAATNRCPEQAVKSGALRSDLLYRLSVIPLSLPPLRERGEDIDLLARLFLAQLNEEAGLDKRFSDASRDFLRGYHWPGNVRELKNLVHRAFLLADDVLDLPGARSMSASAPPPPPAADRVVVPIGTSLAESERNIIFATLDRCGGNKTRAAEVLGVSLKTLYNRLHEYGTGLSRPPAAPSAPHREAGA